jgi:iron complex outermembrane recepter protein
MNRWPERFAAAGRSAQRTRLLLAGATILACGLGMSPHAGGQAAQAAADEALDDEIIVTARRREERLRDVPIAASVLDGAALLASGPPADTRALVAGVPGLRFNDTTSATTSELTLRGSGTGRGTSADSGIGLYRNGVYVGGGLQYGRNFFRLDTFDLERVEVLRGTLGALYGRNAVGGAVNLISARPEFERSGRVDVDYNWEVEGAQAQAVLNEPLSDKFAIRLGVDYIDQSEGFYYNRQFDEFFDAEDGYGARAQLRFRAGNLDANLLLEQQEHSTGKIVAALAVPPAPPNFPLGYADEQYAYFWSSPGIADLDLQGTILSLTYDFAGASLVSTSSYRDRRGVTLSDVDNFSPASRAAEQARGNPMTTIDPGQDLTADDTTRTFYQELHLTGDAGRAIWLLGAEYIDLDSDFLVRFARTPGFLGVPLPGIDTFQTLKYQSTAGYGSLEFSLTDAFTLTGELRYTRDAKDFTTRGAILGTNTVTAPLTSINPRFNNTAYNLIASFDLAEDVMIYAKVGTGYRVGGFNTVVTVPNQPRPVPPTYDNEDSTTYEIGMKSELGSATNLAVAAYLTQVDGALITDTNGCSLANACGQNPTSFTTNGGDSGLWGIELEATTRFDVGNGHVGLEIAASRQQGEFSSGLFDGFDVPQTPEWSASASIDFRQALGWGGEVFAGVDYYAQWGGIQDVTTPVFELADRQIADVRLGVGKDSWQVAAYVDNVLDEEYYVLRQPTLFRWNNDRRRGGIHFRYNW